MDNRLESVEPVNDESPLRPSFSNYNAVYQDTDTSLNNNNESSHKGFRTSFASIFQNPTFHRVDCCSLTCFGILQSDYNRYLLRKQIPPTFMNRIVQYLLIPLVLFCLAGYAAVTIVDPGYNEMISTCLLLMSVFWVIGSCLSSTHRRVQIRREILEKVRGTHSEQTTGEMYCMHRICGCIKLDDYGSDQYSQVDVGNHFCSRISKGYNQICCTKLFGRVVQLFGVCALAQESRELESVIPQNQRRFDYVTFQNYFEYFNAIRKLRMESNQNLLSHYQALSTLSRMLIKALMSVSLGLLVFSIFMSPQRFQIGNMLVFLATFLQAIIFLYFVHWRWHKFDISLDAVVKYFACGFILTTFNAVVFEMVESVMLQMIFRVIMVVVGIKVEDHGGYGHIGNYLFLESVPIKSMDDFKHAFNREYPFVAIVFLFVSAFGVAALVEETSKYFGFKIVDHPDFLQEDELRSAAQYGTCIRDQRATETKPRYEWGGGLDYSFENDTMSPEISSGIAANETANVAIELQECPPRSASSLGTAITIAMVAVALGFACCENLIYIYIYTGQSLDMEISVLISRSLFPIHPLCAAIQSIRVCKQFVEKDTNVGIFQIIFPSVLLHGSYDFVIMLLNFIVTISKKKKDQDEPEPMIVSAIALISSTGFVICGALYYIRESRAQSARLDQMDRSLRRLEVTP